MSDVPPKSFDPTPASALRSIASSLPSDVKERAAALAAIHRYYRQEMIPLLEPVINARIQELAGSSLEEKRGSVKFINEEMRNYGLAVRCEVEDKTEPTVIRGVYPGYLVADAPRSSDEIGRFRFEYRGDDGKPKRLAIPAEPNAIHLMLAAPRKEQNLGVKDQATFVGRISKNSQRER